MKKVLITFAMVASTFAHAQTYPANDPMCRNNQFNCTFEPKSWNGTVEFKVDSNTTEICNKLMGTNDPGVVSCATQYNNGTKCVIYIKPKTTLALVGHEFRHCSEGAWH
jgi:hypothetical protein